jgi:hypothetical protein
VSAVLALEDLLPVEHPGPVVLTHKGFAEITPFLPARIVALIRSQLQIFQEEVARPVARASSAEDAMARFDARMDVVGTVRLCLNRALVDSMGHSDALQQVVASSSERTATRTQGPAYRLLGRPHGTLLLSSLRRASVFSRLWLAMAADWSKGGTRSILIAALLRPEYAEVVTFARMLDGLLLVCAMALEDDPEFAELPQARPLLQGLIENLWEAGLRHNRLGVGWMLDVIHATRQPPANTQALRDHLHRISSAAWYFQELSGEWRSATGHLSIPQRILHYPAYRQLLAMRWDAVPFILGELSRDIEKGDAPWFWGPALKHITGEDPDYGPGEDETVEGVAAAWLRLAQQRGWKILQAEGRDGAA